jgi:hypothetical protein
MKTLTVLRKQETNDQTIILTDLGIEVVNGDSDDGTHDDDDEDGNEHSLPISLLSIDDDSLQLLNQEQDR